MLRALVVVALASACTDLKEIGGGAGWDLSWLPYVDGQVYECQTDRGEVELCIDGTARDLEAWLFAHGYSLADCYHTPRHLGPCTMMCGDDPPAIGGCNAFMGCACPDGDAS